MKTPKYKIGQKIIIGLKIEEIVGVYYLRDEKTRRIKLSYGTTGWRCRSDEGDIIPYTKKKLDRYKFKDNQNKLFNMRRWVKDSKIRLDKDVEELKTMEWNYKRALGYEPEEKNGKTVWKK